MVKRICYEQPLNERIRTLLRLEFLFQQIEDSAPLRSVWATRHAMQGLIDLLNLTSRNELKSELRKELERHAASLNRLRHKQPLEVDTTALESILDDITQVMHRVNSIDNPAIETVRKNDFLSAIRQRSSIPGGTCLFDLPALHHWLQQDSETRASNIDSWLQPLQPLQEAVQLILQLVRESSIPTQEIAPAGFFQKALNSNSPSQLVRVILPLETSVFPEISGGRHRFSIRFMTQPDLNQKAIPCHDDIAFKLVCCVI